VLGRDTSNSDLQDSPWPGLGGSHHLPPYSILCAFHEAHIQMAFCPEIVKVGTFATLGPYNFACRPLIEMKSREKL
jgi:hypothetical protein